MKSEVTYKDSEYNVTFMVRHATLRDGLVLGMLVRKASEAVKKLTEQFADMGTEDLTVLLHVYHVIYPRCMSVTYDIHNDPKATKRLTRGLTAEEFLELPQDLGFAWIEAVYEVNPDWRQQQEEGEEPGESSEPSGSGSNS